jgi:hypothetical protein
VQHARMPDGLCRLCVERVAGVLHHVRPGHPHTLAHRDAAARPRRRGMPSALRVEGLQRWAVPGALHRVVLHRLERLHAHVWLWLSVAQPLGDAVRRAWWLCVPVPR